MRIKDLAGLTALPIERVHSRFRDDEVLAVLPVSSDDPLGESILVGTRRRLAIVSRPGGAARDRLVTRWARWDAVRLAGDGDGGEGVDDASVFRLAVGVGSRTFHAWLHGAAGQAALRDFVIAARSMQEATTPPERRIYPA